MRSFQRGTGALKKIKERRMMFKTNEGGYVTITNSPPNLGILKQDSWSFFLHPMRGSAPCFAQEIIPWLMRLNLITSSLTIPRCLKLTPDVRLPVSVRGKCHPPMCPRKERETRADGMAVREQKGLHRVIHLLHL